MKKIFYFLVVMLASVPVTTLAQFSQSNSKTVLRGSSDQGVDIIMQWITIVVGAVGVLSIFGLIFAGIIYVTSAGEEGRNDTAKRVAIRSCIWLVIAIVGSVILGRI